MGSGWQQSFRELLDGDAASHASTIGTEPEWTGFRPLLVQAVVPEAGDPPPIRSYALSWLPGDDTYRISIKREGLVSQYLHTKLRTGSSIDAAAPRGEFVLASGTEPVLLIAAGVGITPVLSMLHQLAADHRSQREIWWLHAARNADQQAFAHEAHALLTGLPSAHELVFHTAPDAASDVIPVTAIHTELFGTIAASPDRPPTPPSRWNFHRPANCSSAAHAPPRTSSSTSDRPRRTARARD